MLHKKEPSSDINFNRERGYFLFKYGHSSNDVTKLQAKSRLFTINTALLEVVVVGIIFAE